MFCAEAQILIMIAMRQIRPPMKLCAHDKEEGRKKGMVAFFSSVNSSSGKIFSEVKMYRGS